MNEKGMDVEQLQRENMLKAMRAQQEELKYDTKTEISPAEQVEMKSQQYKTVVTRQVKKEKQNIKEIKRVILHEGVVANRTSKVVDIQSLVNTKSSTEKQ